MRLLRCALLVLAPFPAVAGASEAQTLVPHRAVYDLALGDTRDDSQIEGLSGRWVFEFSGSACEGYTLKSRIVMRFEMPEGARTIDQQQATFEDAEGEVFRFVTKSFIDEELDTQVKGTARREAGETVVSYEQPEETERIYGGAIFPTAQLRELLGKIEAGERFYQSTVFDGTEFADNVMMVSVVAGKPRPVAEGDPERAALGTLADAPFVPVTIAYFDGEETADGEETSDYNISFKLHESGVQRDMLIRYDEYSMTARLVDLSLYEPDRACRAGNGH